MIQYEAVIQKGNEALVHHMELFHCEVKSDAQLPDYNGPCDHPSKPSILNACKRVIAAWAMGATVSIHRTEQNSIASGVTKKAGATMTLPSSLISVSLLSSLLSLLPAAGLS